MPALPVIKIYFTIQYLSNSGKYNNLYIITHVFFYKICEKLLGKSVKNLLFRYINSTGIARHV